MKTSPDFAAPEAIDDLPEAVRFARERVEDAINAIVKARGAPAWQRQTPEQAA